MCITEELRKYAQNYEMLMSDKLLEIADRIDFEHRQALNDAFYDAIDLNDITDDGIAKYGLMRLPKDADGEYIHIGDVMEGMNRYDSLKKSMGEVIEISFGDDGFHVAVKVWSKDGTSWHREYLDPRAIVYRHYHEPTVEDVLREFADAILEWAGKSGTVSEVGTWSDIATEYVAKLRPVGDE